MTELYSILTQPEKRWTRYDYKSSIFTYSGTTSDYGSCIGLISASATIAFSFVGSAIRIIAGTRDNFRATNVKIKINGGTEESITTLRGTGDIGYVLVYEKQMSYGNHNVTITAYDGASSKAFVFYGIDAYEIKNKTLILHDGGYKKFTPKVIGKNSTINVVPLMTSDTSPAGKVTARGAYNPAWQAFDRNDSTYWYDNGSSAGAPSWLQYQFNSPKIVNKIILASLTISGSTYGLKEFSLLGSRDGLKYDNLLSVNNHPNSNAKVSYDFNNSNEYSFYKLQFGLSHHSYYALVSSFEMYEMDTPDIPAYWSTISNTLPNSQQFIEKGMDSLSPLLDRTVTELESMSMTNKSEILGISEIGKVFSKTIDLKKYFDIKNVKVEVK